MDDELADLVDLARQMTGAETSQLNVLGAEQQFAVREAGAPSPDRAIPLTASVCSTVLEHHLAERLIVISDTAAAEPILTG